jgi:hypothetical protein
MKTRISKQAKAIADAHIQARINNIFDNPSVITRQDVINSLIEGKTFESVLHQIELRFCSITSIVLSRTFSYKSNAYKSGVYKGFKILIP